MKVCRTAAVLVGCVALAATATADVVSGAAVQRGTKPGNRSDEIEAVSSAGNERHHHHSTKKRAGRRALRGAYADGEGAKAAKIYTHNKKRSLKQLKNKYWWGGEAYPTAPVADLGELAELTGVIW